MKGICGSLCLTLLLTRSFVTDNVDPLSWTIEGLGDPIVSGIVILHYFCLFFFRQKTMFFSFFISSPRLSSFRKMLKSIIQFLSLFCTVFI